MVDTFEHPDTERVVGVGVYRSSVLQEFDPEQSWDTLPYSTTSLLVRAGNTTINLVNAEELVEGHALAQAKRVGKLIFDESGISRAVSNIAEIRTTAEFLHRVGRIWVSTPKVGEVALMRGLVQRVTENGESNIIAALRGRDNKTRFLDVSHNLLQSVYVGFQK